MRLPLLIQVLFLGIGSGISIPVLGQQYSQPPEPPPGLEYAEALFHQTLGRHARLYAGIEYVEYTNPTQGHQYFLTSEWERGQIIFDSLLYQDVPIRYDVVKDMLVIGYAEPGDPIVSFVLPPKQVQKFAFAGHSFIHLADSSAAIPAGFYEQLYAGQVSVYAKRRKTVTDKPGKLSFYEADSFYLLKDGRYHPVKSKNSILNVLQTHKKEMNALFKKEGLGVDYPADKVIVRLVQYHAQLSQPQ